MNTFNPAVIAADTAPAATIARRAARFSDALRKPWRLVVQSYLTKEFSAENESLEGQA